MNKNHGYAIRVIWFRQQKPGGIPHSLGANHVNEPEPKLANTTEGQDGRREIRGQRKPLTVDLNPIPAERVNEPEPGIDRGSFTPPAEIDDRSYRNPEALGRLEPGRRRARWSTPVDTDQCPSHS